MSRDHDGHAGVVFMAFLMGAAAGAAVALLWTPSTGVSNRRLLNEKAREGRERAAVAAQRGREFVQRQREQLATAVERGREVYERAIEDSVESVDSVEAVEAVEPDAVDAIEPIERFERRGPSAAPAPAARAGGWRAG